MIWRFCYNLRTNPRGARLFTGWFFKQASFSLANFERSQLRAIMTTDSHLRIDARVSLALDELQFSFIRASGPGGQNVNKVATAVQLRFDAAQSPSLTETVKRRLLRLAGSRATLAGEIIITAQRFRTQEANRKDAMDRLADLVRAALVVPKKRIKTKPTRASKERRIEHKKRRSSVKQQRRGGWD